MAEYVRVYKDITDPESEFNRKVFVRWQMFDDLARSMGIPAKYFEKGSKLENTVDKTVESQDSATNDALEVDDG